jgi:hypothetical protein
MDLLLRRLVRAAVRRGIAGNWAWLVIAASTFVLRRALSDKGGGVVSSLKLSPGEQVLISVRDRNAPSATGPVELVAVDFAPDQP